MAEQAQVITLHQAQAFGLGRHAVARLVRDGLWSRAGLGVYRRGVEEPTFEQRLWAGVLMGGEPSAIGGQATLYRHGIGQHEPQEITLYLPAAPKRKLPLPYQPVRDGRNRLAHARGSLRLTRLEDALLDCSTQQSLEQFVGNVTDAARLGKTTPTRVESVLRERTRHKNKAELLDVLADLQGIESTLEYVFRRDVERGHGLPCGTRQFKAARSRFDVLYEEYGVIAEVDGRRGHVDGRFRDFRRDNAQAAGLLTTLRYGSYDIRSSPCDIARQLATALHLRGWTGEMRPCPRCYP